MIPSPKIVAAVGFVLVAASYTAGRLHAPDCPPTIEFDHSKDLIADVAKKDAGVQITQTAAAEATQRDRVRTIVKVVKEPSGKETTTTTRDESHAKFTKDTLAMASAQWQTETRARFEDMERTHLKQVAAARPDWAVTVLGGANVDRERFLGAVATRRILGPIEAGVFATTRGDAGLALSIRW